MKKYDIIVPRFHKGQKSKDGKSYATRISIVLNYIPNVGDVIINRGHMYKIEEILYNHDKKIIVCNSVCDELMDLRIWLDTMGRIL